MNVTKSILLMPDQSIYLLYYNYYYHIIIIFLRIRCEIISHRRIEQTNS